MPDKPKVYDDWRQLQLGMHVRLSCGCEGFIADVWTDREHSLDDGFVMLYTTWGCKNRESLKDSYLNGYGPITNLFNNGLAPKSMPCEETPIPEWWNPDDLSNRHRELAGELPKIWFNSKQRKMIIDVALYAGRQIQKHYLRPETVSQILGEVMSHLNQYALTTITKTFEEHACSKEFDKERGEKA
jgi:hypothetical protein